jgi:hypothetical protein
MIADRFEGIGRHSSAEQASDGFGDWPRIYILSKDQKYWPGNPPWVISNLSIAGEAERLEWNP